MELPQNRRFITYNSIAFPSASKLNTNNFYLIIGKSSGLPPSKYIEETWCR